MEYDEQEEPCVISVSYTHLDVYKRQVYLYPESGSLTINGGTFTGGVKGGCGLSCDADPGESLKIVSGNFIGGGQETYMTNAAFYLGTSDVAVSYTHLDVYKRQHLSLSHGFGAGGKERVQHCLLLCTQCGDARRGKRR